jgi:hypothetical protein
MTTREKIERFFRWLGYLRNMVWLLTALGLGDLLKALLATHIPTIWQTPFWLLSSAAILALIAWVIPALIGRRAASLNWCDEIAANDAKNMFQRVFAVRWEPHRVFDSHGPYIDFKITFVNTSVFELKSPRLQGTTNFDRHPLPHPPQLDKAFPLSRGRTWMMIRQFIPPEIATDMQKRINADRGTVNLDFSHVRISFDVELPGRQPWMFTWEGRDGVSVKDITTFD